MERILTTCCKGGHRLEANHTRPVIAPSLLGQAAILESITNTSEWTATVALEKESITPLFDLDSARIDDFLSIPAPERRYLLQNCLPLGIVAMIVAPGGTGKSQFALQLAVSTALGTSVAEGWDVGESGSVIVLFAEEDTPEIHRRVQYMVNSMTLTQAETATLTSRLFIKSMTGIDNFMTTKIGNESVQTDYLDRLMEVINKVRNLKLIIIDPVSRFRGGNEIDNDDATRFIVVLEKLCKATGVTVLFLHHANKSSSSDKEASQNASRGASALVDGVRWVMNLNVMTAPEAKENAIRKEEQKLYVKAIVTKNNYAPPQTEEIWLQRGLNGILSCAKLSNGKMEDDAFKLDKIIDIIKRAAQTDKEYSVRAFCDEFAGLKNVIGVGEKKLRYLINELISDGIIKMVAPKTPRQNVKEVLSLSEIV